MTAGAAPARTRIAVIDMARGIAIVAMIAYHFAWDLGFTGLIALDVTAEPGWILFQRAIVSSFLFLTGFSLFLAHGKSIRWQAFWRRFAIIGGAALLVSVGTYAFSPETFVYFGILHAIALFGFMGLAFLRLPLAVVGLIAFIIIALPLFLQSPVFSNRPLSWIGLWDVPPPSEDLVPVLPWFGVTLAGIVVARWLQDRGVMGRLGRIEASNIGRRALAWAGRWSLVIYLAHQPVMLGTLMLATQGGITNEVSRADNFVTSCQASCEQSGRDTEYCVRYCGCALEEVATRDLWTLLETPARSGEDEVILQDVVDQCSVSLEDDVF